MLNLAILGCGQIGSRHLQALSLLSEGAQIYLLDSSASSLNIAKGRFEEVLSDEKRDHFQLHLTSGLRDLPEQLDVAIVASGAAHRAVLSRSLLARSSVSHLILEKFLFQKHSEYGEISELLGQTCTSTYVNQWMSSLYAFRRIAHRLGCGPYTMSATGAGWGLCCNSPHLLEFFDYLTGRNEFAGIDPQFDAVIAAKREGCRELLGTLRIEAKDGSLLVMTCCSGETTSSIQMEIATTAISVSFTFGLGALDCAWSDGLRETLWIPMQSRLTHHHVEAMMLGHDCGLPSYSRSAYQHLILLRPFHTMMLKDDPSLGETCPIT